MQTYETYVVKAGDTLSKIALFLWGDVSRWKKLADANAIQSPYIIRVGQTLLVPAGAPLTIPITKGVDLNIPLPDATFLTNKIPAGLILAGIVLWLVLSER